MQIYEHNLLVEISQIEISLFDFPPLIFFLINTTNTTMMTK